MKRYELIGLLVLAWLSGATSFATYTKVFHWLSPPPSRVDRLPEPNPRLRQSFFFQRA